MKIKTKNVYYCEYCNKYYLQKSACEKHELICYNNPINDRACYHCRHLEKEEGNASVCYYDGEGYDRERKLSLFRCSKLNVYLQTPQVEAKGNAFLEEDLDCKNIPMLKNCKHLNEDSFNF